MIAEFLVGKDNLQLPLLFYVDLAIYLLFVGVLLACIVAGIALLFKRTKVQ